MPGAGGWLLRVAGRRCSQGAEAALHGGSQGRRADGAAGLWEGWRGPGGEVVRTSTIITTDANEKLRPLHDRMPVVLPPDTWVAWLGEESAEAAELLALQRPPEDGCGSHMGRASAGGPALPLRHRTQVCRRPNGGCGSNHSRAAPRGAAPRFAARWPQNGAVPAKSPTFGNGWGQGRHGALSQSRRTSPERRLTAPGQVGGAPPPPPRPRRADCR
jgi:hypothetical protein